MIRKINFRRFLIAICARFWRDEHAAQLVEFAVSLPLLVLFVVGIFDFSGAFTLKQKLTNVARDAARVAAADPAMDLGGWASGPAPASVIDVLNVVDKYLIANHIGDCGITTATATSLGSLTWQYKVTPTSGSPCGITLTINRGYVFPANSTTPPAVTCASQTVTGQTAIVGTCISVQYTYNWKFGKVSSLLGANASLPGQIAGVSVAMNEN